jgi:hypothetical protein
MYFENLSVLFLSKPTKQGPLFFFADAFIFFAGRRLREPKVSFNNRSSGPQV